MQMHYRKTLPALALALLAACTQAAQAAEGPAPGPDLKFPIYARFRFDSTWRPNGTARYRPRIMAQFGVVAKPIPQVELGLRLSSGDPRDPTGANQSFSDFLSKKGVNFDRFYLLYRPGDMFTLGVGKFGNPLWYTPLIWDSDVQPEGMYQSVRFQDLGALQALQFTLGQFLLTDITETGAAAVLAAQGRADIRLSDTWTWALGTSYYHYTQENRIAQAQGSGTLTSLLTNGAVRDVAGKAVAFSQPYGIWEALTEIAWQGPVRIALDANYVQNVAASRDNRAIWGRLTFGKAKRAGEWQASYAYYALDADASVSAFNDSDIASTNINGHQLKGSYFVADPLELDATLYVTPKDTKLFLNAIFRY